MNTILIIDDNLDTLKLMSDLLRFDGKKSLTADNAEEAILILKNNQIDIILLDISMPNVDGFTLMQMIREISGFEQTPIIFVSAFDDKEFILKGLKLGAADYITKPFHQDELLLRINRHLDYINLQRDLIKKSDELIEVNISLNESILNHQKAERELSELSRKQSTLLKNLPGIAYRCLNNENYTMEFISDGCFELTGYSPLEIIDDLIVPFSKLIFEDDIEYIKNKLQEAEINKTIFELNYRIITKDKNIKWVWEKGQFIYDENNNIIAIEGLINDVTSKFQMQEALDDSRKLFNSFLEKCPIYVFFRDENLKTNLVSKNFENILKLPKKMIIGNSLDQLYDKETAERIKIEDYKVLLDNSILHYNEEINGRHFETIKFPIQLENNKKYIAGFSTDITEKQQYEKRIIESEEKFSKVFINSPIGILVSEPFNGTVLDFNEEFERISEFNEQDILNSNSIELRFWVDLNQKRILVNKILNGEKIKNEEIKIRTKTNKTKHCLLNADIITLKNKKYIIASFLDISNIKLIENELKESEERFRKIIDDSLDGFFRTNKFGKIIFVNKSQIKLFGYDSKEDLLHKSIQSLLNDPYELRNIFQILKNDGFIKDKAIEVKRKDGSLFWISLNGNFYHDQYGNVNGIECFLRDVSIRKQQETELIEKEAKYRIRSESSSDVTWIIDLLTLKFNYISPSIQSLIGFSPEEIMSMHIDAIFAKKSSKKLKEIIDNILKENLESQRHTTSELTLYTKNAKRIVTEVATTIIFDKEKNFKGLLGNMRNITSRKIFDFKLKKKVKTEKVLMNISAKFISKDYILLIEVFKFALIQIGKISNSSIVFYHSLKEEMKDYSCYWCKDPFINNFNLEKSTSDLIVKRLLLSDHLQNGNNSNKNIDSEQLENKSYLIIPIHYGKELVGLIGIIDDKTNRRWYNSDYRILKVIGELFVNELFKQDLENKRIKNEAELIRLRQGIEQSANSIMITDIEGNIVYVNPAFEKITGYSISEAVGKNSRILKTGHTTKREYEFLWSSISIGNKWTGEFLNKKKNGDKYWELTSITPIKNSEGNIINYIAIKEDISKRKKDEENLIYSNRKLEILSEFYYCLNFSSSENDLLKAISHALSNLENYDLVGLYSIEHNNGVIPNLIYYFGTYSELLFQIDNESFDFRTDENPFIESILLKKVFIYNDLQTQWNYDKIKMNESEFSSLYCSPIVHFGKSKYLLVILSERKSLFIEKEIEILDDLNNFITLGIDMMQSKAEKNNMEIAMEKEKEEMNITLASINDAVITLNSEHKIVLFNNAVIDILDFEENIHDKHISSIFHISFRENNSNILNKFIKLINNENPNFDNDTVITNSNKNSRKIINITSVALKDNATSESRLVLSFRDISEKIKLENQLALAQKMDSVGQLAAGIAHEMNTPLQYVGNNTLFLNDAYNDLINYTNELELLIQKNYFEKNFSPEDLLKVLMQQYDIEYLRKEIPVAINGANSGIKKVSKIISSMKNFAHPSGSEKSKNNINDSIETIITISRNEWKYSSEIELNLDNNLPLVYCSIDEINQVILNMIINSSHAIQEKYRLIGKIGLITISTYIEDNYAVIEIKDDGKGIKKENIDRIFDPFYTTKEIGKGTGQGLSISHNIIINRHNGLINVDSVENEGTIFKIKLPII